MRKRLFSYILLLAGMSFATAAYAQVLTPAKDAAGRWGYMQNGQWMIQPRYDKAFSFSEGLAEVMLYGKYGYIDRTGESVIPFKYEQAWPFSEGLAVVKLNGKWGFIGKDGKATIPFKYDDAKAFTDGLAAVKSNGKWGFVDREGHTVIPFKYEQTDAFSEGLAPVKSGYTWGYVDRYDHWYATKDAYEPPFSDYAKRFVERRINTWQTKGKYEKTADWQLRVNERTRNEEVARLTREAETRYISDLSRGLRLSQVLGDYDADNEVFLVKDERFGNLLVPVAIDAAQEFENTFLSLKRTIRCFIADDHLALAELVYSLPSGKTFRYDNMASLDYTQTDIDYRFAPVEIETEANNRARGVQNIRSQTLTAGVSDVDENIPQTKTVNDKTFVVIFANERYNYEADVPFASADGESFRNYCIRTLGIPEDCINFHADATINNMRMAMKRLSQLCEVYESEEPRVIFYYSGHGIPDEQSRTAYLLPVDADGADPQTTGYSLAELYRQLGELPAHSVTVFLDACFSGATREGGMIAEAHGVAIKPRDAVPESGNVVVFAASQGDETAQIYSAQGHGMFTYFLLKKLQASRGASSLGELAEYLVREVQREALKKNNKMQTPSVTVSPAMDEAWRTVRLR